MNSEKKICFGDSCMDKLISPTGYNGDLFNSFFQCYGDFLKCCEKKCSEKEMNLIYIHSNMCVNLFNEKFIEIFSFLADIEEFKNNTVSSIKNFSPELIPLEFSSEKISFWKSIDADRRAFEKRISKSVRLLNELSLRCVDEFQKIKLFGDNYYIFSMGAEVNIKIDLICRSLEKIANKIRNLYENYFSMYGPIYRNCVNFVKELSNPMRTVSDASPVSEKVPVVSDSSCKEEENSNEESDSSSSLSDEMNFLKGDLKSRFRSSLSALIERLKEFFGDEENPGEVVRFFINEYDDDIQKKIEKSRNNEIFSGVSDLREWEELVSGLFYKSKSFGMYRKFVSDMASCKEGSRFDFMKMYDILKEFSHTRKMDSIPSKFDDRIYNSSWETLIDVVSFLNENDDGFENRFFSSVASRTSEKVSALIDSMNDIKNAACFQMNRKKYNV